MLYDSNFMTKHAFARPSMFLLFLLDQACVLLLDQASFKHTHIYIYIYKYYTLNVYI